MNYELRIKKSRNTGFTLIESLVAISIFTMSILGLMSILASSISNITYAKHKITAEYLAQEGIEYVRNLRDTDVLYSDPNNAQVGWDAFKTSTLSLPSSFSSFTRTITKTSVSGTLDEVKIISDVSWTQGSGTKHVILTENLFNWVE